MRLCPKLIIAGREWLVILITRVTLLDMNSSISTLQEAMDEDVTKYSIVMTISSQLL